MAQWTSKPTPERPYLQTSQQLHQQCGQKKDHIRHYFATTLRRATNLIHNTIQKIGSNPSLDEVIQLLDARHGLHEAYINMEDELDDFINFDTVFINSPGFYTKLIAFLVRHTIRLLRTVASYPIFIYFLLFSVQETESACAKVSSFSVMFSIAES